jgi:hypothetical protein
MQFKDLATSQDIPVECDSHLAVAAKAFESFNDFSLRLKSSIPDFLGDDYREKLEGRVRLTRGGTLSNFLSHPV